MANYTLTDLLLFSAGAILVIYIYIYYIYKQFGLYEFGRWRQPLPWPFFFDGEKERMTQKASVNSMSCAQQPLTRDSAMCNLEEAKLATIQPIYFCPHTVRGLCWYNLSYEI